MEPEKLIDRFEALVRRYTLSDETGLCAYIGFDPSAIMPYARKVKAGEVTMDDFAAVRRHLDVRIEGRGIIGAAAAIPFYTNYAEALLI